MMLLKQRCIASVCLGFLNYLLHTFFFSILILILIFSLLSLQAFDLKRISDIYFVFFFLSFFRLSNIIYSVLFELNLFFSFCFFLNENYDDGNVEMMNPFQL